jgi:MFS transporter, PAT family, beta-lactamase induction signal transducer AmpG
VVEQSSAPAQATDKPHSTSPSIFVPTLYVAEGLPYAIVNTMSLYLFKNLGLDNASLTAYTTLLAIPWSIKFLWAPLVDKFPTRKRWIVVAQMVLAVLIVSLILALINHAPMPVLFLLFLLVAFSSATHDVAIDGFYLDALNPDKQALFVGIRSAAYKLAMWLGSGPLVSLAGWWAVRNLTASTPPSTENICQGWSVAFAICAVIFVIAAAIHMLILPNLASSSSENRRTDLLTVVRSFINQPRIAAIICYILLFRCGDALMLKMAPVFLLDPPEKGGLGLPTELCGLIYGTVGVPTLVLGGLLGGWLVSKYGLKKCLLPTALIQNFAILFYWGLAALRPGLIAVAITNSIEQFVYGLGTAAYTVFLLDTVKQEYKASHYAIATALMAVGLLVPGYVSGSLQTWLGYQNFFLVSFICAVPGIISILYLPLDRPPFAKSIVR